MFDGELSAFGIHDVRCTDRFADQHASDPKGAIDKSWDYMPGGTVTADIRAAVAEKLSARPYDVASPLIAAMNREAVENGLFAAWRTKPDGDWPLVRIPDEDAKAIGAQSTVGQLSAETMRKQDREPPELTDEEYAAAQDVIDRRTGKVKDGPRSMIYIHEAADGETGYVLVVKATVSGEGTWVTSYRRLSRRAAYRDREIRRLLERGGAG